jgi:hypothetical protein
MSPACVINSLIIVIVTIFSALYWIGRFKCPDDPAAAQLFKNQNIAAIILNSGNFKGEFLTAIQRSNPLNYVDLIVPRQIPMSAWLPINVFSPTQSEMWQLLLYFFWGAALLVGLVSYFLFLKETTKIHKLDIRLMGPLTIAGIVLVWGASQLIKNDYEASLILPLCAFFIVYSLCLAPTYISTSKFITIFIYLLLPAAIISQVIVIKKNLPILLHTTKTPGYLKYQPNSISIFGYDFKYSQIEAAEKKCRIDLISRPKHLLLDELTYFSEIRSWQPYQRLGLMSDWKGTISDPLKYIKAKGSDGFVMGCHYLTPEMLKYSKRVDDICCMGSDELDEYIKNN